MKKVLIGLLSAGLFMSFNVSDKINAEESTLKIVASEDWTASYYLVDYTYRNGVDYLDYLYDGQAFPYLSCHADIFNDGTLRVSFWNNHEWEKYTPDSDPNHMHDFRFILTESTYPYSTRSQEYAFKNENQNDQLTGVTYPVNISLSDNKGIIHSNGKLYIGGMGTFEKNVDEFKEADYTYWDKVDLSYYPEA